MDWDEDEAICVDACLERLKVKCSREDGQSLEVIGINQLPNAFVQLVVNVIEIVICTFIYQSCGNSCRTQIGHLSHEISYSVSGPELSLNIA